MNRINNSRGFTLIEMLVALVIFSSLLTVMFGGFQQGLSLWDKGDRVSSKWERLLLSYNIIEQLFVQSVASRYRNKNSTSSSAYFIGTEQHLSFVSAATIFSAPGVVLSVELRWKKDLDVMRLEYRQGKRGKDPGRGLKLNGQWHVLLDGLQSGKFIFEAPVYYPFSFTEGTILSGEIYRKKAIWRATYDARKQRFLPRRVALVFKDAEGIEHHWRFLMRTSSGVFNDGMYGVG